MKSGLTSWVVSLMKRSFVRSERLGYFAEVEGLTSFRLADVSLKCGLRGRVPGY